MLKTKIVCTLGPASNSEDMIEKLIRAGMNVARLNFSHGTHEEHAEVIDRIKRARAKLQVPVAIMLDTKGPEIRLRKFAGNEVTIQTGASFTLTTEDIVGNAEIASITYPNLPKELKPGDAVLLDDGNISLSVAECTDTEIRCTVTYGGVIKSGKGVNIPNIHLDMVHLSDKDKADLIFGIEHDVDFIAASFMRNKMDVIGMRKFLDYNGGHSIKIISKIENLEGVDNFDEILNESDGIMVARGDMGVEVNFERLPGIQKRFIKACYQSGKMVITATQMLESMIEHSNPTRAEISDVANAVFDGTSAVMLSGETAVGKYPLRAVAAMAKIAEQAEQDAVLLNAYDNMSYKMDYDDITNAICDAACTTAKDSRARAIITMTASGRSARRMSKFRPTQPIVAATPVEKTYHQLALSWGVYPVLARLQESQEGLIRHAIDCAKQIDIVAEGDRVVVCAGVPVGVPGTTNLLKVEVIGGRE
ncbi:MAG: pyruvate kinase [Ruminococcaceae bacterium]|nr:pyruvate kinase [Oscillospiraceae bacterium]